MKNCLTSIFPCIFFFAAFVASLAHAAPKPAPVPANSEIVELPTYTVTNDRVIAPEESWRYAALPDHEILSNVSERTTKRFIEEFQLARIGIQLIWPDIIVTRPTVPTLILLCTDKSFKSFLPTNADPGAFITPTSLFVEDKERGAIVIDFSTTEIFDSLENAIILNDPYKEFCRQYTRFLMRRANGDKPIPPWLESGLSQIFTTIDVAKKSIEFARISEDGFAQKTAIEEDAEMIATPYRLNSARFNSNSNFAWLEQGSAGAGVDDPFPRTNPAPTPVTRSEPVRWVFPLNELFNEERAYKHGPYWNRECFAFVHMCLYGQQKKYQKAFVKFARLACAGPVTESDFIKCFNQSSEQMTRRLRSYVSMPNHESILLKVKRGSPPIPRPTPVALREATDAEVGRIKGETLRLAGYAGDSRDALIAPYIRKHADASLLASLGLLETLEGRKERARKFLEAAAKEKAVRPRAYVELARLRYDEALAAPKIDGVKFDAAQTSSILEALNTARSQPPPIPEVYLMIADTWHHSAVRPQPAQLEALIEGIRRYPRSTTLLLNAAELHIQNGDTEAARHLIKAGIAISTTDEKRKQFEDLRDTLGSNESGGRYGSGDRRAKGPRDTSPAQRAGLSN